MKKIVILIVALAALFSAAAYTPSEEVRKSQAEFAADRFGIFIHWGIYSMFG